MSEQLTKHDVRYLGGLIDGARVLWLVYTEGPDYKAHVLKRLPDGTHDHVADIPGDKHSALLMVPDGADLWIVAGTRDAAGAYPAVLAILPGLITPLGTAGGPPPVISATDTAARTDAAAARQAATTAQGRADAAYALADAQRKRIDALPAPSAGLSESQVADIAWAKANDALWAASHDANGVLLAVIHDAVAAALAAQTPPPSGA